jgi:AcrR family transcriptional regulator
MRLDLTAQTHTATADERVIACAAELFLKNGIDAVKMTDIAEAAEVGVATIYRHFQTKAYLAAAAGTLMWQDFNRQVRDMVESDEFLAKNGIERLAFLFGCYCRVYVDVPEFVVFLDGFDHLMLTEQVPAADLAAYGETIDSFYFMFDDAYLLGRQDGSIACDLDFKVFYQAVAHALMGAAEKFARGKVIPSDETSEGRAEIESIVDMAVRSLKVSR